MVNLPTAFQQFYNSGFKYRPSKKIRNGKVVYKTNSAKWAKQ